QPPPAAWRKHFPLPAAEPESSWPLRSTPLDDASHQALQKRTPDPFPDLQVATLPERLEVLRHSSACAPALVRSRKGSDPLMQPVQSKLPPPHLRPRSRVRCGSARMCSRAEAPPAQQEWFFDYFSFFVTCKKPHLVKFSIWLGFGLRG